MKDSIFTAATIRRLSICYFGASIFMGVARSILGPSIIEFSNNTSVQLREISILFMLLSFGNLVGNGLCARLYDHLPGNKVLIAAILSNSLMLALAPIVSNFRLLAAMILLLGIGYGMIEAGDNTLTMWLHGKKAGSYISGLYVFIGIGSLLTPALIGLSIDLAGSVRFAFWTFAAYSLPVILLLLPMPDPVPTERLEPRGGKTDFDIRLAGFVTLLFFLCIGAQVSYGGWIYTYAVRLKLANEVNAALITSIYWIAQTSGLALTIPLLPHVRPQRLLVSNLIGGLASLITLMTWNNPAALWVGAVGLGLSLSSLYPASFAYVRQRMTISGKANGWFLSGASLGAMVNPWIVGQVFTGVGPLQAMQTITLTLGMGLILLLAFFGYRHRLEIQP